MVMRAHLRKTEEIENILNYLTEHGCGTASDIARETGMDVRTTITTLQKLNGWRVKSKRITKKYGPRMWELI